MPEFQDGYHAHAPKLTKQALRETIRENVGRVVGEEHDRLQNAFVVRKKTETGPNKVTLIDENGNESAPLGRGVCRHCGSDFDDTHNGSLGNAGKCICPTCHAWIPIP